MKTSVTIDTKATKGHISRHIYGHFAEHLGRCIYDGVWVGPDSDIPNQAGIRNDVLEALRRNAWNVTRSAEETGMQRANFQALMKKHRIRIRGTAPEADASAES